MATLRLFEEIEIGTFSSTQKQSTKQSAKTLKRSKKDEKKTILFDSVWSFFNRFSGFCFFF